MGAKLPQNVKAREQERHGGPDLWAGTGCCHTMAFAENQYVYRASILAGCFRIMFSLERIWINWKNLALFRPLGIKESGNEKPKTEHLVGQIWPRPHGLLTSDLEQSLAHSRCPVNMC